jgi:predicted MFS family arabinose efflux permease
MNKRGFIISVIVLSEFACGSLWFAGNAVIKDLIQTFSISPDSLSHLTSAVQFGFITGTLCFAFLTISDRFSPSKVFFVSALLGAGSNFAVSFSGQTFTSLLFLRFATGFFLAGIYPVGMKISSDYYEKGLGKALGFLVGALVLGTSFPHLLKNFTSQMNWKYVIYFTSGLSITGGLLVLLLVPDGPYRKPSQHLNFRAFYEIFKNRSVRLAASGYFGHMWELYTFWTFVPFIFTSYARLHPEIAFTIPLLSFITIASGAFSCAVGGYFSLVFGSRKTAFAALASSGFCCLISPLVFNLPVLIFLAIIVFWGMAVVADSPQFSTLVAQNADDEYKGTALTIVNCIGFAITIVSIEVFHLFMDIISPAYIYLILASGPLLGLIAIYRLKEPINNNH